MPKNPNQKLKLLFLYDIMLKKTDEFHSLNMAEIINELALYGIKAERKSIYDDFEALRTYGLEIVLKKGREFGYYAVPNKFELAELKLLVDAVQSANFITHKKSSALIKKIENLCSIHQAKSLQRFVFVNDRIKTENESVYYTVDAIHNAIANDRKISFQYLSYSAAKEKVYKKNGAKYTVSPMALLWDDEKYYLLAFDEDGLVLKHYRVDKVSKVELINETRDYKEKFDNKEIAVHSKKFFSMFGGEEKNVTLRFDNSLIGVVIDRFGKDIVMSKYDENSFVVKLDLVVSPQFFAWLCGFGTDVEIISPKEIKKRYKKHLEKILKN